MGKPTSLEERMRIWALAEAGMDDGAIAATVGWTVPTVRKWRRRASQAGRAGLVSQMGRPRTGALGSFAQPVRETVREHRTQHPGWGPLTLVTELQGDACVQGRKLPSRSAVARYLHERELTRPYERHSQLPDTDTQAATAPHEVWEMDARGHEYVPDVGVMALVNINDRHSHARILSYPVQVGEKRWQRHPNTEDYQLALRLAFLDWGLPQQVQVDHESVFFDNHIQSPFPTRLHLWLLALGIHLRFGRTHQPTDQAMTERSHQLWAAQVLYGQRFASWQALYQALRERRDFLNTRLPCAALDQQAPLQACPAARHSGRPYHPQYEADLLNLDRVWTYLAQGQWFRLVSKDGTLSLGKQVYYVGRSWARQQMELRFDPTDQHICCYDAGGDLRARKPIRNLSNDALMGDLALGINLPSLQLVLPFDHDAFQVIRLFETLPV